MKFLQSKLLFGLLLTVSVCITLQSTATSPNDDKDEIDLQLRLAPPESHNHIEEKDNASPSYRSTQEQIDENRRALRRIAQRRRRQEVKEKVSEMKVIF